MLQILGCLVQNGPKTDTFVFQENRMILLIYFYIVEARVCVCVWGVNYAFLSFPPLEELEINAYQSLSIFVLFEYLYSKSANFVGEFPIIPSWGGLQFGTG